LKGFRIFGPKPLPNGQLAHKLATWSGGVAQKGGVWRGLHEFLWPGNLTKLIKSLLCRFARPAAVEAEANSSQLFPMRCKIPKGHPQYSCIFCIFDFYLRLESMRMSVLHVAQVLFLSWKSKRIVFATNSLEVGNDLWGHSRGI